MDDYLGLFVKNWVPEEVKTRLAKSIGAKEAAEIYKGFVETSVKRFGDCPASRILAYTPNNLASHLLFSSLQSGWQSVAQSEGNLGKRMHSFFYDLFSKGAKKIVLIGSDSPNLPIDRIHQAFQSLEFHDVVLGPSSDGGYYLVGCKKLVPPIFQDISWSTPKVWESTIEHLENKRIKYMTLEPWYDVDEYEDLQKLLADLSAPSIIDPFLCKLKDNIFKILSTT